MKLVAATFPIIWPRQTEPEQGYHMSMAAVHLMSAEKSVCVVQLLIKTKIVLSLSAPRMDVFMKAFDRLKKTLHHLPK
jgi:hypothetical protein